LPGVSGVCQERVECARSEWSVPGESGVVARSEWSGFLWEKSGVSYGKRLAPVCHHRSIT
jgi:hypothetical protein